MTYESFKKFRTVGIVGVVITSIFILFKSCGSNHEISNKNTNQLENIQNRNEQTQNSNNYNNNEQNIPQQNNSIANTRTIFGAPKVIVGAIDNEILQYQRATNIQSGKPDDNGGVRYFVNTNAYKLDLRSDKAKGFAYWNRIKVDYDKDKQWDEKWSFGKDGKIKREISSSDDGNYDMKYELNGENWERK
ncbi:MAG: hypothetical protein WAT89_09970 [Candidatus Kapaibacterium sp.]